MSCQQPSLRQVPLSHAGAGPDSERPSLSAPDAEVCAFELASSLESSRGSSCATFRRGELVAKRFVVEQFLARGGMGEIYVAHDRLIGERVALKTVLSVAADDPSCIRMLRQELRLGRRIAHPNVCRVFDVGVHDENPRDIVHFLTMELVRGESVAARLKRSPLSMVESLRIGSQLLLGLEAVHQAGVLHRDVKSHNILLDYRASTLRAVLADFGLARRLDARQRAPGEPNSGSLPYMAPEQMTGGELSPATDLFAFGVILFEMCTGRLPFERPGEQRRQTDPAHLWSSAIRDRLRPGLLDFLSCCLSHSPAARYQSARAALNVLTKLSC